jgi:hypothetical protein
MHTIARLPCNQSQNKSAGAKPEPIGNRARDLLLAARSEAELVPRLIRALVDVEAIARSLRETLSAAMDLLFAKEQEIDRLRVQLANARNELRQLRAGAAA